MSSFSREEESADDFSSRMVDILNASALNVAIGMGSKTGLFEALDTVASAQSPVTVEEIAKAANLNPRVVREWLGIVVSGNIVEVQVQELIDNNNNNSGGAPGAQERFWLPSHRAPALCRRGGGSNLSLYCQEIPILTNCVYQEVLDSFTTGVGIPYSKYPPFQDFMNHLANQKHQDTLIQTFLPSIDGMVDRLQAAETKSMRVMDLGCGQGVAITLLAREFPNSTFVGIDLDADAIQRAQEGAHELTNLSFVVLDATQIQKHDEFAASFDYVMAFDAIHDLCHPEHVLKGIHDALKPGGMFSMIDIKADSCIHSNRDHPMGPLLYTVSLMHCMQVAMVDGGKGLGMMWGRQQAIAMLEEAGFRNIKELDIPNDGFNLHFMSEK